MNTVKLKDTHLGVLQFAHKEKDEIEAMPLTSLLLRSISPTSKTHARHCKMQLQKGIKVNPKSHSS